MFFSRHSFASLNSIEFFSLSIEVSLVWSLLISSTFCWFSSIRHRHVMRVVESTPLHGWFRDSLEEEKMEIWVNSYHRQGVKRLAQHFVPMAFAPDGLIEGFYDHDGYNLREGKRG
ncbi:hypothetical protein ACOSQ2_011162 [Xanthoceras sorbifolium]